MADSPRISAAIFQDARSEEEVTHMLPDNNSPSLNISQDTNVYVVTRGAERNKNNGIDTVQVPENSIGAHSKCDSQISGEGSVHVCFDSCVPNDCPGAVCSMPVGSDGASATAIEQIDDADEDAANVGCNSFLQGDFHLIALQMAQSAEEFVRHVWMRGWQVVHHHSLPIWLKDNDFLVRGHRPELKSFRACFKSIFRVHTETGNIWTHLLETYTSTSFGISYLPAFVAFIGIAGYFLSRPSIEVQWQEKAVFSAFFAGAILCLGFSWLFHTVYCHSQKVGLLFNKLDYCGIALLTMGSFVPWLYYSFYCRFSFKVIYLCLIMLLGSTSIIVSMFDKFAAPQYRPLRAAVFICLGLSGVIPCIHYIVLEGFYHAIEKASLGWFVLMAFLYISGAVIYAVRIPERIFPGRFDLWFQSHQIFHVFVVAAAFVHFHGITEIANYRLTSGDCNGD